MKKLAVTLFILAGSLTSIAQTTAVSALVSDTSGTNWANGPYTITFVPVPGNPGPYNWNGNPFVPQVYTGSMDAGGNLAISLPSNTSIFPSGTQWKFTVCPQASSQCRSVSTGVTGTTQNLTSTISAGDPTIQFSPTP